MFYSETLLSKTGPLARVWLSANLERKLSKTHILQSNIETSVDAIVAQDQAPMALRLSGQLLLGVVRIYSRKARYLLEDCNEALMKIKMAFRPGNVDLPAGATAHSAAQLTLPDAITEFDLLLPDPTLDLEDLELGDLLTHDPKHRARNKITLDDEDSLLMHSQLPRGTTDNMLILEDDDMGLDLGQNPLATSELDLEMGRDAQPDMDDIFSEANMTLDHSKLPATGDETLMEELDLDLGLDDDLGLGGTFNDFGAEGETTIHAPARTPTPTAARARSDSPLSSVRSSAVRDLSPPPAGNDTLAPPADDTTIIADQADQTFTALSSRLPSEDPEHTEHHANAPSRKRKIAVDQITELKAKQIKAQQSDRTSILRDPSFLPRDPTVLALMSLTRTGALAHSVFYPKNIAPELTTLLAPDFLRKIAEQKRKRDALEEGEHLEPETKHPRIEEQQEEDMLLDQEQQEEHVFAPEDTMEQSLLDMGNDTTIPFPASPEHQHDEFQARSRSASPSAPQHARSPTPPPVAVSRETRAAVHILREHFHTPSAPAAVFQELLPVKSTTAVDATKLFFEVLVLATKDAVTVEQVSGGFGEIRVGQKEGLWGSWAEERDEQEIADEERGREEEGREEEGGRLAEVVVGVGRA